MKDMTVLTVGGTVDVSHNISLRTYDRSRAGYVSNFQCHPCSNPKRGKTNQGSTLDCKRHHPPDTPANTQGFRCCTSISGADSISLAPDLCRRLNAITGIYRSAPPTVKVVVTTATNSNGHCRICGNRGECCRRPRNDVDGSGWSLSGPW